jgi:hypothetical protein
MIAPSSLPRGCQTNASAGLLLHVHIVVPVDIWTCFSALKARHEIAQRCSDEVANPGYMNKPPPRPERAQSSHFNARVSHLQCSRILFGGHPTRGSASLHPGLSHVALSVLRNVQMLIKSTIRTHHGTFCRNHRAWGSTPAQGVPMPAGAWMRQDRIRRRSHGLFSPLIFEASAPT